MVNSLLSIQTGDKPDNVEINAVGPNVVCVMIFVQVSFFLFLIISRLGTSVCPPRFLVIVGLTLIHLPLFNYPPYILYASFYQLLLRFAVCFLSPWIIPHVVLYHYCVLPWICFLCSCIPVCSSFCVCFL